MSKNSTNLWLGSLQGGHKAVATSHNQSHKATILPNAPSQLIPRLLRKLRWATRKLRFQRAGNARVLLDFLRRLLPGEAFPTFYHEWPASGAQAKRKNDRFHLFVMSG